jgi:hypothetical protein
MSIVESGHDAMALEIDNLRPRTGQLLNLGVRADGKNAVPGDGKGLGFRLRRVFGPDLPVQGDHVHLRRQRTGEKNRQENEGLLHVIS